MAIIRIEGLTIREPTGQEMPAIAPWFASSSLGVSRCAVRAAFSSPGDVPLGALIVRTSNQGRIGQFTLYVRPECRRHGIGRSLVMHLYQLALANKVEQLIVSELIPQDHADNAFYRGLGLTVDTELGLFELDVARQVVPLCERVVKRFIASHPHLRDVRIAALEQVDPRAVASFIASHYGGFVDALSERLRAGSFDRGISTVSVRSDGSVAGAMFVLSRGGDPLVFLDLIVTEPAVRNGPTPLVLFDEAARRALAIGKTHVAFEADLRRDAFAVNFAARCGVTTPQRYRYRYSITREQMQVAVSTSNTRHA